MVERSVSENVGLTVLLLCLFVVGSKDLRFTDSVIGRRSRTVVGCFAKSGFLEMSSTCLKFALSANLSLGLGNWFP